MYPFEDSNYDRAIRTRVEDALATLEVARRYIEETPHFDASNWVFARMLKSVDDALESMRQAQETFDEDLISDNVQR